MPDTLPQVVVGRKGGCGCRGRGDPLGVGRALPVENPHIGARAAGAVTSGHLLPAPDSRGSNARALPNRYIHRLSPAECER